MNDQGQKRGIIDSKNRILEDLLGKTAFKDALRQILNNIDPENSPQLVRTLIGKDIEVALSLVAALPSIANALILALDELLHQIKDNFPLQLIADITESLVNEVDTDALARVMDGMSDLNRDLSPIFRAALVSATDRPDSTEV